MMRFGPAGLGSIKEALHNLEKFHAEGIRACEIAFTYGIYIKEKEIARKIGKAAEDLDIALSIHAPYWVNLNSLEQKKWEMSQQRILDCCRIGHYLGVKTVVFHPGYYGKGSREEAYVHILEAVRKMQEVKEKEGLSPELAAETMGKVNVFGSLQEILNLVKESECGFCIDFAHLLARSNGILKYDEMYQEVKNFKKLHCHFSGIAYGDKGEKHHIPTPELELKKLLEVFPRNKEITIINESPVCVEDSIKAARMWEKMGLK